MTPASVPAAMKKGTVSLHETVASELAEAGARTLFERWWSWVGRAIAGITRATGPVPFWARATCGIVLMLLLDFGLTLATQPGVFRHFVPRDSLWAAYTLSFLLLMRGQFIHHQDVLRLQVLPHLPAGDLADVRQWMRWLERTGPQVAFSILGGSLGLILSHRLIRQSGTPASAGQLFLYFMDFFLMSMLTYLALLLIMLYRRIGGYQFSLYRLNPSQSAVLIAMYQLTNGLSLAWGAIVALFMVLVMRVYGRSEYLRLSFTVLTLFTWIPILVLFAVSQRAFSSIIMRVKNQELAQLQLKISQIEASADLSKPETVEWLKGLLDYYQRIAGTPNSMLNAQVIVNLVNSLILPVLGSLASNYERILRLR